MKGKLLGTLVVSALAVVAVGSFVLKPTAEHYLEPIIQEQLNNALNGKAEYGKIQIGWDGTAHITDVVLYDDYGARVLGTPEISVSLSPLNAIMIPFTGASATSLISTVTVKEADIHLWENQDNSWNINNLIKKRTSSEDFTFKGDVVIEKSEVYIATKKGRKVTLDDLNGKLAFKEYPKITGVMTTKLDGNNLRASGEYRNTSDSPFTLSIVTNKLNLDYLNEVIPENIKASVTAGTAENVNLRLVREADDYRLNGSLDLANVGATYSDYTVSQGSAHIVLNNQVATVEGGSLKINDQFLTVAGSTDISQTDPNLDFHIQSKGLDLSQLASNYGVSGQTDLDVYVNGSTQKPEIHGFANVSDLNYDAYTITKGKAQFSYDAGVLLLPNVEATVGDGNVKGNGWYNLDTKAFEFYGDSDALPIGLIANMTGYDINGSASGHVYAKGSQKKIEKLLADIHGDNISYQGITLDTVDTMVEGSQDDYTVDYLNATMGDGAFTGYGTINGKNVNLSLNGTDIPASVLNGFTNHNLDGTAAVTATVSGELSNPTVNGQLVMHQGGVDQLHFQELYGDFSLENQVLALKKVFIEDGHGSYNATGTVGLSGDKNLNLDVALNDVRIENTIKSFTDLPITGWLSTSTHVGGTMDTPTLSGHAHMWDGSAYGKLITDISTDFNYENNTLVIPNLVAKAYGATLTAEGQMTGKNLDFRFSGNQVDLEPILRQTSGKIKGIADLDGTITGTVDSPILESSVTANSVIVNNSELTNINGSIYVTPDVVHVNNISFYEGPLGYYQFQGGLRMKDNNSLYGTASVTNGSLATLLTVTGLNVPNLNGILTGEINLSGTTENPGIDVQGRIDNTTIGKKNMGTSIIDATLSQRKLDIKKFEVPLDGGLIAAAGTANLDGQADIQVAASNVPVEDLMPLTGKEIEASGILNITANISGQTQNPKVELSAEVDNGTYNGVTIDKIVALATMENKVITINQMLGQKDIYSLKAYGKIPLAALYKNNFTLTDNSNPNMDLTIDASNADLGILPLLTPIVKDASGDMTGLVNITGTLDSPRANGTLAVKDGKVHFKAVGKDLENINTSLVFKDRNINLDLASTMGKGTAIAKGVVNWSIDGIEDYNFALDTNKLEVDNTYFDGPLTSNFTFNKENGRPKLTGVVNLEDTKLDIPFFLDSGENSVPLNLDLTINAGKKVRLCNSLLYDLTVEGSARFRGSTVKPISEGEFNVKEGYIKYLNTRFKLDKGKAKFTRGSFLPYLSVNGKARVSTYDIFVDVTGPVSQMDMKLTSDPALTEQQIISLLTFRKGGNMSSEVDSKDANALLSAGLQAAVLGSLQGRLQDSLGLDVFNISTGTLDENQATSNTTAGYYNIELGKYIIPNLLISYSKGLNYNYNIYSMQYELGSKYSVKAWRDNRDNSFAGIQWHYTF